MGQYELVMTMGRTRWGEQWELRLSDHDSTADLQVNFSTQDPGTADSELNHFYLPLVFIL